MKGSGRNARTNRRGAGWITHPGVLALLFVLIAIILLAVFVPLVVVFSLGVVLVLVGAAGLGGSIGIRNLWAALISVVILVVGVALLVVGVTVSFIG